MDINVYDRSHELDPSLRDLAIKKVQALARHFAFAHSASVEFATDLKKRSRPLHTAKVTFFLLGHRLPSVRAHASAPEARAAFDLALGKLDAEMTRLKEQVESH